MSISIFSRHSLDRGFMFVLFDDLTKLHDLYWSAVLSDEFNARKRCPRGWYWRYGKIVAWHVDWLEILILVVCGLCSVILKNVCLRYTGLYTFACGSSEFVVLKSFNFVNASGSRIFVFFEWCVPLVLEAVSSSRHRNANHWYLFLAILFIVCENC